MSEMFTKCNGFIVSGDPLVYADSATMTGQGTVSEPFGVKSTEFFVQDPLYIGTSGNSAYIGLTQIDSTVLYNGILTSAAQLSEPMTNFEKIELQLYPDTQNSAAYHSVHYIMPTVTTHIWDIVDGIGLANCWISIDQLSASDDFKTLIASKRKAVNFGSFGSTATAALGYVTAANCVIIKKVVGIGRKNE